jgi:L-lactate dehydrogenase complex protein LldE
LDRLDQCCGFGGAFSIKHSAASAALAEDKLACLAQADVDWVICNEAGCAMQITGSAHRAGQSLVLKHVAELLDEARPRPATDEMESQPSPPGSMTI